MPAKKKQSSEAAVREIRRRARRRFSAEEKIRIVLEGLRGEESIAALCRREGIDKQTYSTELARVSQDLTLVKVEHHGNEVVGPACAAERPR